MKMENEELLEQEEQVEETTLLVRKSRTENGSKITQIDFEVTTNGHIDHSELIQNEEKSSVEEIEKLNGVLEKEPEAINDEKTPAKEQEVEELNGVLEKEPESINGEKETEELNGVLEKESEAINEEKIPAEMQETEELLEKESEAINGEKPSAQEQEIEKQNAVEPEAMNGEQKSQNLVFHDHVEGIWKCRLCSWTYRNGSVCVDHFQSHRGQLHKLMNLKTFNFQSKGVDSTFTFQSKEFEVSSLDFVLKSNSTSTLNNGYGGAKIEANSISSSIFKAPKASQEIESAAVDQINEDDLEVADLDVERVIQKQTTHDLFCPNCKSCITKRVILRKRKRRIRISDEELELNQAKTPRGPELAQPHNDGVAGAQITEADEDEPDKRRPALFRCLSCFSFFIPTEDGFKCLPIKEWFASMFSPNKGTVGDQGNISHTVVPGSDTSVPSPNLSDQSSFSQKPRSPANVSEGRDENLPLLHQKSPANGNVANGDEDSYTQGQVVHNNHGSSLSATMHPTRTNVTNWKAVKDTIVFGQEFISGNKGSSTLEESDEVQLPKPEAADDTVNSTKGKVTHWKHVKDAISFTQGVGRLPISKGPSTLDESVQVQIINHTEHPGAIGNVHHSEGSEHITNNTNIEIFNKPPPNVNNISGLAVVPDTVLTIDPPVATPSQTVQGTSHHPSETPTVQELVNQINSERTDARDEYEIEVVKSIVYGGLAESITSLSVVSSAAGGGAATLNILALGAANLIGGLFIICQNLWDLRYHQIEHVSNQINEQQQDRYTELLGRRQSFVLHAVIAIISYIIFGLVPPLVYGFSFRQSDDKQLKLVVVGSVSLFCILILAIAKAYTRKPPKPYLKTVATYLVLGFMVSGVGYVAGQLVERILNELGLFETTSVPNMEMKPTASGWASY